MDLMMLLLTGVILFVAAAVQGIVGFAMAIVAVPLLVWTGGTLSEAIAISSTSTFVQAVTGMVKLRHAIPWPSVRTAVCVRLLALPVGIWLLVRLHEIDPAMIKAFLGVCIALLVLLHWCLKIEPLSAVPAGWSYLAFASSGLFAGMVGMGGPPLVLWVAAHNWNNEKIKAFLYANFAILSPLGIVLLWVSFGDAVAAALGTGILFAPIVVVGSLAGVRLGAHISRARFRKILFTLLLALAFLSIAIALPWQ